MEKDNRKITIYATRTNIWSIILPYISLLSYFLFVSDLWSMGLCTVVTVTVQILCGSYLLTEEKECIWLHNIKKEIANEQNQKVYLYLHTILLFILNLFPILSALFGSYEGGIVVFVLVFMIEGLYIELFMTIYKKNYIEEGYKLFLKKEAEEAENKIKTAAIKAQNIEVFGNNYYAIEGSESYDIIVSEEKELLKIGERTMKFSDIIDFKVSDDATELFTPSKYESEIDTGNMLGRAVVGGLLTGGIGAIIGGATASRNIIQVDSSSTKTIHNFQIYITLNNIKDSCYSIKLGAESDIVNKLSSVLTFIVYKNKQDNQKAERQSLPNSSVADELLKLAELKKQGILSEEEFLIQKQNLLK